MTSPNTLPLCQEWRRNGILPCKPSRAIQAEGKKVVSMTFNPEQCSREFVEPNNPSHTQIYVHPEDVNTQSHHSVSLFSVCHHLGSMFNLRRWEKVFRSDPPREGSRCSAAVEVSRLRNFVRYVPSSDVCCHRGDGSYMRIG